VIRRSMVNIAQLSLFCFGLLTFASAQTITGWKYTKINFPGAVSTSANSINDGGAIVGYWSPFATYGQPGALRHGFWLANSHFYSLNYPGAVSTAAYGISDYSVIVGSYRTADGHSHGFWYQNGTFHRLDVPGASDTEAMGVNKARTIVGHYLNGPGNFHGFEWRNGVFVKYDLPGSTATTLSSISNLGVIVGLSFSGDSWHAFVKHGSDIDLISPNKPSDNSASGVNGRGDVVGAGLPSVTTGYFASNPEFGETTGDTEKAANLSTVSFPGALATRANGITYGRAIVGTYADPWSNGQSKEHGFVAIPR
jgi:uncharacterized membrane protein